MHALLDLHEVFGREGLGAREIVIEAGLGRGTEGHLRLGIEFLHRLGHDMRRVVADDLDRFGRIARQDRELGVVVDRPGQVAGFAVELTATAALARPGPIEAAISPPVMPRAKRRTEPSGSVIAIWS